MESELLVAKMIGGNSARFEVEGSANQYFVIRFSGTEAVSELYEFQIEVTSRFVTVDELVGALARLRLAGVDRAPREIHGLICRAEYAGEMPPRSLYRITLVPELWRLKLRTNSRIFQQMSTPEILEAVLAESGIRYQPRLGASYAPRDYCVQYRESDLAFVRRLMEEDGIAFYFEHSAESHTLVLSDINTGRVKIEGDPTLIFRIDEQVRGDEHVRTLSFGQQITSDAAVVRDYDLYASQDIEAQQGGGQLELYDAPIGSRAPAHATAQAKIRLEEARVPGIVATGTSDCPRLVPGHSFTLAGHLRGELDGDYHLLRTVHRGEQPRIVYADAELVYDNDFVAVPVATPYRPPRVTPRPMIRGVQVATVVGPAGEEIHVDAQGRVKVQFHWDRSGQYSELSSCWVRVSQAWAGPAYGSMFIPRIGHEVLVEFIEGDPDRPIITGRIYDGTRTPPYPLPDEKTKSTIKSDSSPGGGGFNELRFEDAKGAEEIYVHAQLDMNTDVLRDATRDVGRDDHLTVANNQTEDVGVDRTATVGNNETTTIGQHQTNTIGGDQTHVISANQTTTVTGGQDTVVGGDQTVSVYGHILTAAAADNAVAVGGNQHVQVQGVRTLEVGVDQLTTVLGNVVCDVGMMVSATIGTDAVVNVGANHYLIVGAERYATVGANDTTVVAGSVTISAATITLTAGGSTITLYPGGIDISTAGVVSINGSLATVNM